MSSTGSDTGSCQLAAPCKTNAGGEVDVKDSGAYGPFTITKTVNIVANGVLASVGIGSNFNGITIAADAGATVGIYGLTVDTHDKADPGGDIVVSCACHVVVDHNVLQGSQVGVDVIGGAFVVITNSLITGNIAGVYNAVGAATREYRRERHRPQRLWRRGLREQLRRQQDHRQHGL